MPRACVPNARFLASADSPLLSLLAPRVFADTAFTKRGGWEDGRGGGKELEKGRCGGVGGEMLNRAEVHGVKDKKWRSLTSNGNTRRSSLMASSGVLHSSGLSPRAFPTGMDLRYADISSFVRQQLRSYSTRTSDVSKANFATNTSSKTYRISRRACRSKFPRKSGESTVSVPTVKSVSSSQAHRIARRRRVPRKTSRRSFRHQETDAKNMNLRIHRNDYTKKLLYRHDFEVRRRRALSFILLRLNRYRTHSGLEDSYALMNDGRYRSLRRRYANYSRKKSELIDLTVQQALLLYPRGRVKAFAFLDRRAYPELRRKTHYLGVYHDPRCREWTAKLFRGLAVRNEKVLMNNWMSFDGPTRNLIWPYLLVYLLHIWPGRALYFLQLLVQRPEVDNIQPDVLADAFGYLSVVYAQKFKLERSLVDDVDEHVAGLVPAFTHFLRKYRSVLKHVCPQDLIYRVSILAHGEDLKPVFDILEDEKIFLLFHTILHYTNEFSKAGEIDYALRCLAAIETRARDQPQLVTIANLQSVRWSCALLLRKSAGKRGEEYHRTTDIVARLVELGMKLDNLLYNVIMHNAMDAGDYSTAFQVYNSLETNGLKPDKYTFAILLHGCTMTEDPFKFNDFADYCADVAVEMRDAWVAADYLYYIYICQQRSDETDNDLRLYNYSKITEAYARYFNTAGVDMFATADFPPLAQQHSSESPTNPDFNPMQPPPIALYLILQFRIQIAAVSLDQEVWHLYLRFRQVVRAKHDPVLNKLAQNPVIWNAFLLAFTRKNKFEWASDVIKDMADSFPYPKPNVYSWNIFMQGFFKTDQIPAAERIFEIMRARGIDPDRYTYGTLLRGFVRRGHYDRIGQVMEYVEDEEQMAPDLITMLGRVHNRERLVKVMEESEVRKRERKVREERKKEAAVRKRWRKVFVDVDEDEGAKLDADESEKGLTFGSVLPRVARQGLEPSGENGGLRPRSIDESFL